MTQKTIFEEIRQERLRQDAVAIAATEDLDLRNSQPVNLAPPLKSLD